VRDAKDMPSRSSKRREDTNQIAARVVSVSTGQPLPELTRRKILPRLLLVNWGAAKAEKNALGGSLRNGDETLPKSG